MADIAVQPPRAELEPATLPARAREKSVAQTGSGSFPELVWAHYRWERERHWNDDPDQALEQAYLTKLAQFEKEEGPLAHVYWSTRNASAVGLTVKPEPARKRKGLRIRERDDHVRLHRVSDWVTRDGDGIADLLQEGDLLAIRVGEVLRGTSERIAMRWILGVEEHLLGYFERSADAPDDKAARELVKSQRKVLGEIEAYYHRAAAKAGRIVYVSGMLIGIGLIALLGGIAGLLLWAGGLWPSLQVLVLCYGAGALGALVSAISRMSKPERGRFNIDFELGRPLMRRLGVFRPFVGAVIGVVVYAVLESGILQITVDSHARPYYYGLAAFLAGFSERFANVVLGAAERRLAPSGDTAGAAGASSADDDTV